MYTVTTPTEEQRKEVLDLLLKSMPSKPLLDSIKMSAGLKTVILRGGIRPQKSNAPIIMARLRDHLLLQGKTPEFTSLFLLWYEHCFPGQEVLDVYFQSDAYKEWSTEQGVAENEYAMTPEAFEEHLSGISKQEGLIFLYYSPIRFTPDQEKALLELPEREVAPIEEESGDEEEVEASEKKADNKELEKLRRKVEELRRKNEETIKKADEERRAGLSRLEVLRTQMVSDKATLQSQLEQKDKEFKEWKERSEQDYRESMKKKDQEKADLKMMREQELREAMQLRQQEKQNSDETVLKLNEQIREAALETEQLRERIQAMEARFVQEKDQIRDEISRKNAEPFKLKDLDLPADSSALLSDRFQKALRMVQETNGEPLAENPSFEALLDVLLKAEQKQVRQMPKRVPSKLVRYEEWLAAQDSLDQWETVILGRLYVCRLVKKLLLKDPETN